MFGFHYLSLNICLPVVLGKAKSPLWGQTPALGAAWRGHSREGSPLPSASSSGWQGVGGAPALRCRQQKAAAASGLLGSKCLRSTAQIRGAHGCRLSPALPGCPRPCPGGWRSPRARSATARRSAELSPLRPGDTLLAPRGTMPGAGKSPGAATCP